MIKFNAPRSFDLTTTCQTEFEKIDIMRARMHVHIPHLIGKTHTLEYMISALYVEGSLFVIFRYGVHFK